MSAKKGWIFTAFVMGMIAVSAAGCSHKQEPQMIDVASRLEQARAERAALAAQQQPVQTVQTASQPAQQKVSYIK